MPTKFVLCVYECLIRGRVVIFFKKMRSWHGPSSRFHLLFNPSIVRRVLR